MAGWRRLTEKQQHLSLFLWRVMKLHLSADCKFDLQPKTQVNGYYWPNNGNILSLICSVRTAYVFYSGQNLSAASVTGWCMIRDYRDRTSVDLERVCVCVLGGDAVNARLYAVRHTHYHHISPICFCHLWPLKRSIEKYIYRVHTHLPSRNIT